MDMDEEKSRGTDSQENTVNDSSGDVTYHYTRPQYGQYRFHEEQQTTREDQDEEDTSKVKVTLEGKDRKPVPFKKKLAATIVLAVIFGLVAGTVFQAPISCLRNILAQHLPQIQKYPLQNQFRRQWQLQTIPQILPQCRIQLMKKAQWQPWQKLPCLQWLLLRL